MSNYEFLIVILLCCVKGIHECYDSGTIVDEVCSNASIHKCTKTSIESSSCHIQRACAKGVDTPTVLACGFKIIIVRDILEMVSLSHQIRFTCEWINCYVALPCVVQKT